MLNKYSVIAIALFGLSAQSVSAGNEQAQRMILGGSSVGGTTLPAALTYKPELAGHDQARALLAPVFVSGGYIGASTSVPVDGHEQARQMIVKQ
ncbi:MAG TPA: hypothetical protein VFH21_07795 [Burkholderiales bacterium]|nr:hypothetical protein [Burkholderiales bacterium]